MQTTQMPDDPVNQLLAAGAKVYLVGGAVRDALLGRASTDADYAVQGATVALMLAAGFRQVGADFPVFLHPQTQAEYALARTERKTGAGYGGFTVFAEPTVTLEEDLGRRDLTINAMASPIPNPGCHLVIDPFNGCRDLSAQVLRHVRAETFIEDPVRVLRLARFAARFTDFTVAEDTLSLCRQMVADGLLDELVGERIWKEVSRGLMEAQPSRMFEVLRACGALAKIAPELDALWGVPQAPQHHPEVDTGVHVMMVVDQAAKEGASLKVRFGCLLHDLGKGVTPEDNYPHHIDHETLGLPLVESLCERWKTPAEMRKFALLVCEQHQHVHRAMVMRASSVVRLFMRAGAFNSPATLENLLQACRCDARGRLGLEDKAYPQADFLLAAFRAAAQVDAGEIALSCKKPAHIPERILSARSQAVMAASKHDRHREYALREGKTPDA